MDTASLYWLQSILVAFLLTCSIFILAHPYLSARKYPVFFVLMAVPFFLQMYLNFTPLLFVTLALNSLLLVKFTEKPYTVYYIPMGYIINCVILNLITFAGNLFWDISIQELNANPFLLTVYEICAIAVSFPVLYLVRRLFRKYLIGILEKMGRKLLLFIALTLLLCAFMLFTMASFFDHVEITHREFFLMVASLVLYFLFTFSMILIVLHTVRKGYEARKKVEYLENLNEYTRNLEMVYNNLRSFRHDYINIMASLAAYIDERKYEELGDFFYEHILPMQKNLSQKNDALNHLLHVKILELKSILYTKLLLAVNQDIEVNIDIPDEIDSVHMDTVDLTRMLGIYLDNAIEACLETERPVLNFHLGKVGQDVVFILSNSFIDRGLSVTQMHKKDVTTKGDGHGLGLHIVSELLSRYDNIFHETLMEDGLFIQQVRIS